MCMSEDSDADRRTDCGVDGPDRATDDRAVQSITSTSSESAATVEHSDARHPAAATR